jgi:class 3 adenylate cyclase
MATVQPLTFGALLKRHRRVAGLTQEALAERSGYSVSYVSMLERGERAPLGPAVELLAAALGLADEDRAAFLAARRRHATPDHSPTFPQPVPALGTPSATSAPPLQTFLIADIRGYTRYTYEHGDEAGAQLAMRFAALVREGVAAWYGQVLELRGDEALVVFGSARQALRAAVALQARWLAEQERDPDAALLPVGIGLDAGEAVPVEGGYRGGALNLAARLCSLAGPGDVLASETVIHLAHKTPDLRYIERGVVQLKGLAEPVRIMQIRPATGAAPESPNRLDSPEQTIGLPLSSAPRRSARPPRLVGRLRELALLERHLAGEGPPVLLLAGEPGIGKTRLLREAAERARDAGWTVLEAGCTRRGAQEPYSPILGALEGHIRHQPQGKLRAGLEGCAWLVRLLPELAEASLVPVLEWRLPPEQERRLMFRAAGRAGTLLALDDLQWAGSDALDLLAELVRSAEAPLRVVGAYRSTEVRPQDPLGVMLTDLAREGLAAQSELGPLAPQEAMELLHNLLEGGEIAGLQRGRGSGWWSGCCDARRACRSSW